MSNLQNKPNGTALQLVELMQNIFTVPNEYRVKIVEWSNNVSMIKDYLQNKKFHFLVSVKRKGGMMGRVYDRVPLSELVVFEVCVWSIETPEYLEYTRSRIRDSLVGQVQAWLRANSMFGTEKASDNLDYANRVQHVLCTRVLVTQLNEELT